MLFCQVEHNGPLLWRYHCRVGRRAVGQPCSIPEGARSRDGVAHLLQRATQGWHGVSNLRTKKMAPQVCRYTTTLHLPQAGAILCLSPGGWATRVLRPPIVREINGLISVTGRNTSPAYTLQVRELSNLSQDRYYFCQIIQCCCLTNVACLSDGRGREWWL